MLYTFISYYNHKIIGLTAGIFYYTIKYIFNCLTQAEGKMKKVFKL